MRSALCTVCARSFSMNLDEADLTGAARDENHLLVVHGRSSEVLRSGQEHRVVIQIQQVDRARV